MWFVDARGVDTNRKLVLLSSRIMRPESLKEGNPQFTIDRVWDADRLRVKVWICMSGQYVTCRIVWYRGCGYVSARCEL